MMQPLIDLDSPPPPSNDGRRGGEAIYSVDLLLGGSDNDEAVLQSCPLLSDDAYQLPATSAQPGEVGTPADVDSTANPLVATEAQDMIRNPLNMSYSRPASETDTTSSQPAPIQSPDPDPASTIRNASRATFGRVRASQQAQANFIISHIPEVASGLVEAIQKELGRASISGEIQLRETQQGNYIRMTAPGRHIAELIGAAQDAADDLISNDSRDGPDIFQEPPTEANSGARVILDAEAQSSDVRPLLKLGPGTVGGLQFPEGPEEYATRLNECVYKGLKKAGRLPLPMTLRVHLGRCMLRTYPKGKKAYEYHEFHAMIENPRVSGWLKTSIGDEVLAQKVLDFVRNDSSYSFLPTSNQVELAADVLPQYVLEIRSHKYKLHVPVMKRTGGNMRGAVTCQLHRVTASKLDENFTELDILNLSVGKNLDWAIEAVKEEKGEKSFPDVVQYLRGAQIELRDSHRPHDLNVYPRVTLGYSKAIAGKVKDVAMKTVYQFRWKTTSYIVQLAVSRRWDLISAMVAERTPIIDLEVTVFGEYWDSQGDSAGNIWGDELQYLLEGHRGSPTPKGIDRVDNFLQTVRDIRNALDHLF